jgi:hypothetical protein
MFMFMRELSTARLGDVTVRVAVNCVASLLMLMLVAADGAATSGTDSMPRGEMLRGAKPLLLLIVLLKLALGLSGVVQRMVWPGDRGVPVHTSMLQVLKGVLALAGEAGTAGGSGDTAPVLADEALEKGLLAAISSFFWESSRALTSDLYCSGKQLWLASCRCRQKTRENECHQTLTQE